MSLSCSAPLARQLATFGTAVAAKFATAAGEPEDHLRGPLEALLPALAELAGAPAPVLAGEERLGDIRVRPDYAVHVGGALAGFIEVKAPGKGADPTRYRDRHDREQWGRLSALPNVLYTDGGQWGLYRAGEPVGEMVSLVGRVEDAGARLRADDDRLLALVHDFLTWAPTPPRTPGELALVAARLCRLVRAEVAELLATHAGLQGLAADWRDLLFPEAGDEVFADGYAQTVTFALLLARVERIDFADGDLGRIADRLGERHGLIGTALDVLTNPRLRPRFAVSVQTLVRVLAVVDWPTVSRGAPEAWLLFYEDFLQEYDPSLRRATGSYYTPHPVVDAMVRLVEDLLRSRLGRRAGFAAPDVTVVDPAMGTGTFLFRILDRIAETVAHEEGEGAVPAQLRAAVDRLVGFELQTGPFAVAELRLAEELRRRGASVPGERLRVYVADTLDDPYVAEHRLAAVYEPIARSRRSANEVKKDEPVVVVIGNPPYRERAAGAGGWIERGNPDADQPAPLRTFFPPSGWGLGAHAKHLYNLYVYFWRWATWKVFEHHPSDRGVVALITVAGFISGPGFAGMRAYLRRTADAVWVIDLSPEGHQPDVPTRVFAGVQQPVCITLALRDGSTDEATPAPVLHRSLAGRRDEKFAALAEIGLEDPGWDACPTGWGAPFLPAAEAGWEAMPALADLLPWHGSGTMPGRTWVIAPSPETLLARWDRLIAAPPDRKAELFQEHKRDRTVVKPPGEPLPGFQRSERSIADEAGAPVPPVRYGFRSLDRQWIVPDKRLINQPNPALWKVRSDRQVFLTALQATAPRSGPAATLTHLVPDLDHYKGSFGGRAFPLWRDAAGTEPNVAPGLLAHLGGLYADGAAVTAEDLMAYLAAVLAHPAYTARFAADLAVPGLRVPLTADGDLFREAVALGRRVVWLHTYGERMADAGAKEGRPPGPPRLPDLERPRVTVAIPDDPAGMPERLDHDAATRTLHVGAGRVAPVAPAAFAYEISGVNVLRKWFNYRKRAPEGRRESALDKIVAERWEPALTTELLELLNVLGLLVALEPAQAALLERIVAAALADVAALTGSGVLPVPDDRKRPPAVPRPSGGPVSGRLL